MLSVFLVLAHDRRRIVYFNVMEHPTAQWTAQQFVEAFPFDTTPHYLIRDGDGIYGDWVRRRIRRLGIKDVVTVPASPWQNAYVERVIGSLRRELLNHVIILNKRHLKRLLSSYFDYSSVANAPVIANPGLNYWSINPIADIAYSNPKTGFKAGLHGVVVFNTENPDTDYRSGTLVHLEGSVQQLVPAGKGFVSLRVEGFWVEQVSADSGQRPIFGDFKGRTAGLGPVLGSLLPMGGQNFVAELRWLREFETKNRLEVVHVWLKLVYQI